MRERLTKRIAADAVGDKGTGIMNDPYQVNNPEHEKNDPAIGEYAKGDPSAWGEDVNKESVGAAKDKRDPDTHIPEITAKMAAEAIQAGRKLEEKAVKCIVASQRILPGASDNMIESQAADLMHLPDNMVDSLLGRQEELATTISKAASEACEDPKKKDEDEEVEAACKKDEDEEVEAGMSPEDKEKLEGLKEKQAALESEIETLEGKKPKAEKKPEDGVEAGEIPAGLKKFQEEQKAGKKPEDEEEEVEAGEIPAGLKAYQDKQKAGKPDAEKSEKEEKKPDGEEEISFGEGEEQGKDASQNLLDDIFSGVIASDSKIGAKSLSGLVKKEASASDSNNLSGVWKTDPDVSQYFK